MKTLLVVLLAATGITAQSLIPQALKETISLAPKSQPGDMQKYHLEVEYVFLTEEGYPKSSKSSFMDYIQLCVVNNPDSGIVYEINIDSFTVGGKDAYGGSLRSRSVIPQYDGMNFRARFRRTIPVKGDCYDFGVPMGDGQHFSEDYDFLENYIPLQLLEQLRYTAGRRLSLIGDTATMTLPRPICYKIKKVINDHRLDQSPLKLTLAGITTYRGQSCALVKVETDISYQSVEIYSTDTTSIKANGTTLQMGEFLVSLNKGQIVKATIQERSDSKIDLPDGTSRPSHVWRTLRLTQKN